MPRKGVLHHQWQKKMDTKMSDHVNEKNIYKICMSWKTEQSWSRTLSGVFYKIFRYSVVVVF